MVVKLRAKAETEKEKEKYSVQYTFSSIMPYLYGEKKGTQFFASLFLPHCALVDGYSIRGTIIGGKKKGRENT
jgi:hypothetical protein